MNTRRIVRISPLLGMICLLAAVSFAAAQQPGPVKEAAAIYSPGESAAITPTGNESEPNNTVATADMFAVPAVMAGTIGYEGDVDYFEYYGGDGNLIVEIDAQKDGSWLDSLLCEMGVDGEEDVRCNNWSDGLDSMLYTEYDGQYIRVEDVLDDGGADFYYTLLVYQPLLLSPAANGTVMGVAFNKSDILANFKFGNQEKWMLFFDASDVGITQNVNGLFISDPTGWQYPFYLTFAANQALGGGVTATPWDIVGFTPEQLGPSTHGQLSLEMRGLDWEGLTAAGEKIDAIAAGTWYSHSSISTTGVLKVPMEPSSTYVAQDEDLSNLNFESGWWCCGGMLDGSTIPGLGREDVTAAHYSPAGTDHIYLVIQGTGKVGDLSVTQKDIFAVDAWNSVLGYYWRGKDHGFLFNLDAIDLSDGW